MAGYPDAGLSARGRGLVQGLVIGSGRMADQISAAAFDRGLLMETCGPEGEVVTLCRHSPSATATSTKPWRSSTPPSNPPSPH